MAKAYVEAGYGVNGLSSGDRDYMLLNLEYRLRGFQYVGLRFERFAGAGTDITKFRLTFGTR